MKIIKEIILGTVVSFSLASTLMAGSTNQLMLVDDESRLSYALGMYSGKTWKIQRLEIDPDVFARGAKDEMAGQKTLLTSEEAEQIIVNYRSNYNVKQQKIRAEMAAKNKAMGDAFLATNKTNPGVITLPDGLQYLIISKGSGVIPVEGGSATVHYRGALVDGTEFDSSIKRGQPFTFHVGVDRVISAWTEAIKKMPVGSKWKLFIPAELAYGEQGRQGIPPNSVLIFEVELLSFKAPPPPPAPVSSDIIKVPSAEEREKGAQIEVIKSGDAAQAPNKPK